MTSIQKSLTSGVFYTGIAKYSNIVFAIVIGAVLARLLTPEEFGVVALVTVFVTFFNLLGDFGIGKAVVQNQNLTKHDVRSIFSFSILFAFLLAFLFFLAAPFIARFYDTPDLFRISRLLSLAVLFNTLLAIPRALLEKALKFKRIGIITVLTQLITGIIAIILAYKGFSYYALVIMSILNGFFLLVFFYISAPVKLVIKIDFKSINKIISFSIFNFLFNFINYFTRNGDNLLIGKFLGSAPLGFYDKAYQLMMLPPRNLTNVITPVMVPIFARHQDDKSTIYNSYLKIVKFLATIGFPLSVFLFFSAYEIVNMIYGSQWEQTIPAFKILASIVGVQIIYSSAGSVFLSINRTKLMFIYGIISSIILIGCILLSIVYGKTIVAVAYAVVFAFVLNFIIVYYMLIKIALKQAYLRFFKVLLFPLVISGAMIIPLMIYSFFESENIFVSLAIKLVISGLTFISVLFSKKDNIKMFKMGIKQYINK
jgi:teichuronic acid exporter